MAVQLVDEDGSAIPLDHAPAAEVDHDISLCNSAKVAAGRCGGCQHGDVESYWAMPGWKVRQAWLAILRLRRPGQGQAEMDVCEVLYRMAVVARWPVSRIALRALERRCAEPGSLSIVAYSCRPWTAVATGLLLAPAPESTHRPSVRLVSLLDADPDPPTPEWMRPRTDLPRWFVHVADSPDHSEHGAVVEVLRVTDQPDLLNCLYERWLDSGPRHLTDVVLANPHQPPGRGACGTGRAARPVRADRRRRPGGGG